jgi:CubicO group peptidase (beta-lactamase class C family)
MPGFPRARRVFVEAIASGTAPCGVVEVGRRASVSWREAAGRLTDQDAAPAASVDTVFDLASLTKVLATASAAMRLADEGRLDLGTPVADLLPRWRGRERERVRVSDLLAHSSGLPAYRPLYRSCTDRGEVEAAICAEPLEYDPGARSVYSDLGFMLLGFVLEAVGAGSLDRQFDEVLDRVRDGARGRADAPDRPPIAIRFCPPRAWRDRIAPTRAVPARPGVVDDQNASVLGGVAGHAGLFGTAAAVGLLARALLDALDEAAPPGALARRDTARRFVSRAGIPGSSRALGWDTMLPTSSCGTRMSARAFGHTGFTGTSLWIDPEAGIYVVLLTNRVYPAPGPPDAITALRRALHDAVMADATLSNPEG